MIDRVEIIRKLKVYFAGRNDVAVAYLFGSVARSAFHPLSDVDIAVYPRDNAYVNSLEYRSDMIADMMELLKINPIDVVLLNEASPLLAHRVMRDGVVVDCKDQSLRVSFEVRALRQYIDTKHLRDIQQHYLKKRVQR